MNTQGQAVSGQGPAANNGPLQPIDLSTFTDPIKEMGDPLKIIAEELDAVFLWALEALPASLDSGKIAIPETCGMDFDNFKSAINPLFDFAREALVFHENATVKPPDLYKVYQAWAKDGGTTRLIGKHRFYDQIRLHYRTVHRVRPLALPGQQGSVDVFQGVGILDGTPWAPTT